MRTVVRVTFIVLPLIVLAARMQFHTFGPPQTIAKELARYLSVVRIAASRRSDPTRTATARRDAWSGDRPAPDRQA
jgi:hypothetical protein